MSILHHETEQVPGGEALLAPELHTDLTSDEMEESFLISRLGSSAISEHIMQLENIFGHACMLGTEEKQTLRREIAVYRHAQLVTEG